LQSNPQFGEHHTGYPLKHRLYIHRLWELLKQPLNKGSRIYVASRLHTLRWEDAATGERHAHVEIVLDDLILLDRRDTASGAAAGDGEALPF
jgi:single-stranded DNA-binding protein